MFNLVAALFIVAFLGSLAVVTGLHLWAARGLESAEALVLETFWYANAPPVATPLTDAALEVADVISCMSAIEADVVLDYNPLTLLTSPTNEAVNFSFSEKLWFSGHRNLVNQVPCTDAEAWTVRAPSFIRRTSTVRLCNW